MSALYVYFYFYHLQVLIGHRPLRHSTLAILTYSFHSCNNPKSLASGNSLESNQKVSFKPPMILHLTYIESPLNALKQHISQSVLTVMRLSEPYLSFRTMNCT